MSMFDIYLKSWFGISLRNHVIADNIMCNNLIFEEGNILI